LLPSGISIDIFKTEKGQPGAPQGRPDKPSRLEGHCLEDRLGRLQEYFNLVKVRLIRSASQPWFANIGPRKQCPMMYLAKEIFATP
jgi:hypothetical protein